MNQGLAHRGVGAAAEAVGALVKAFVLSMPTGKQNTFANRTRPDLVVVQIREDQPVNLSEAFEDPIEETRGRTEASAVRLAQYAKSQDEAYATSPVGGAFLATGGAASERAQGKLATFGAKMNLEGLVKLAEGAVRERVQL